MTVVGLTLIALTVARTGGGNLVSVTNSLAPSAIIGGIPVYGNPESFKITGNPLAGLGTAGTIVINGVTLTPATAVSKLTGSLVAIQGSGSVRIGP